MAENNSLISERLFIPITAVEPVAVSGESITIPAGTAGTIVNAYTLRKPILKGTHDFVGGFGNSSLALTSTTFLTEVSPSTPDASLQNGQYWVDYVTGMIRGRKADNQTSMTASYYVFQAVGGGSGGGTITFYDSVFFAASDGVVMGGTTVFTLPVNYDAGSEHVYVNGQRQRNHSSAYTRSGTTLTFPYLFDSTWEVIVDGRVTTP